MNKINFSRLMLGLLLAVGPIAKAGLNYSSDCVAYKNESIKCDAEGKSVLGRNKSADKQPYGYYDIWQNISYIYTVPEGWASIYVNYVSESTRFNSDVLLKDNYLRLIDYINKNHLTMNFVNNSLYGAEKIQKCAASIYVRNMKELDNRVFSDSLLIPGVETPLDAMKLCNETDYKLLNCGLDYIKKDTYPGKSFRWVLNVCKEKHNFRGTVEEIYGSSVVAKSVHQSEVGVPPSFLEAWKIIGSTPLDSLTQVQSTKSVFSQLNQEWLGLIFSAEYESGIYSNRNRVLAPLFFYVLGNSENLELSHRTRFKIDLINNIDFVFSVGPSVLKNKSLLDKVTNEKKEILRLIEAI